MKEKVKKVIMKVKSKLFDSRQLSSIIIRINKFLRLINLVNLANIIETACNKEY